MPFGYGWYSPYGYGYGNGMGWWWEQMHFPTYLPPSSGGGGGAAGGDGGGEILFEGVPEQMLGVKRSFTAKFLKEEMKKI